MVDCLILICEYTIISNYDCPFLGYFCCQNISYNCLVQIICDCGLHVRPTWNLDDDE